MSNMVEAQIFKRANRGERETVRMKLYALDGTPCEMDILYSESTGEGSISEEAVRSITRDEIATVGALNEQSVRDIVQQMLSEAGLLQTGYIRYAGEWGPAYTYSPSDAVTFNGGLYYTTGEVTGGDLSTWVTLASPPSG